MKFICVFIKFDDTNKSNQSEWLDNVANLTWVLVTSYNFSGLGIILVYCWIELEQIFNYSNNPRNVNNQTKCCDNVKPEEKWPLKIINHAWV